jgi:hypothetical protein
MPKQSFPLASFSDRDTCGLGWLESGFCESLGKRRLLMSEESGDPPHKDAHFMTSGRGCDADGRYSEKPTKNGAPDRIRTCDLWNRNPTLYPAELRVLTVMTMTRQCPMGGS